MKIYNDYIVDSKQLKLNCLNIKKLLNNTKLCAIVKANAYGMGIGTICKSLYGVADFFGVANISEAMSIREFDNITPILILGKVDIEDLPICSEKNISISIPSLEYLESLKKIKSKIKVHIQINSGLNRFGIRSITEFKKALRIFRYNENIILEGIYSHFATKSNDKLFINIQFYKFLQFRNIIKDKNVISHIANSYATSNNPKYHLDMVRCGFLMYTNNQIGTRSILTIKSKIIHINHIKKGDTIGYDRTMVADKKMTIAVIPIGYADGLDRRLSNNFSVIINNHKCRIVGMICMDVFMVDVSDIDADIGDQVIILGKSKNHEITLDDYAKTLGTSPYEILLKFNYKRMNYIVK